MIGRRSKRVEESEAEEPRGFDDFDLRLGDVMRGERATLGKSLLDVERELRIKAAYVAAIENCDPAAFDTPGFIPGYVRSYARYLGMDPDRAFRNFCAESGFSTAHGMSAEASSRRAAPSPSRKSAGATDLLTAPVTPFAPAADGMFSRVEPGAIGSGLVLLALIGAIGYGGWAVLNEVQRVQLAPMENTPDVLSDLDPLDGVVQTEGEAIAGAAQADGFAAPRGGEGLDRLYRPEALDVPVMVARDAPISTLDPAEIGTLGPGLPRADRRSALMQTAAAEGAEGAPTDALPSPQVVAEPLPEVRMVAVRPAWVRVRAPDGSVIFEGIMNAGDTWDVPAMDEPPTLRVGESGAVYFAVNGQHYGPAGQSGQVTSGLALDAQLLAAAYDVADLTQDADLSRYVAEVQPVAEEAASQ